jgi:hypothetical protein
MTRKLTRTGIAAIVLAGTAIAGSALPAQAKPAINPNTEYVFLYYSTPQHTMLNGYYEFGCDGIQQSGSQTGYLVYETYHCYP